MMESGIFVFWCRVHHFPEIISRSRSFFNPCYSHSYSMVTFMPHTIVTMTTFYITDSTQAVVKTYRSMVASAPTAASSNPSNDINDIHDVSHHHHHQEAQQEERQQQQHEPPSPFDHLKWHELLTFSFVKPIVKLGLRKTLDQDDLHPVAQQDRASVVTEELEREWQSELERAAAAAASGRGGQRLQKPSLWRAFYRAHRYEFIISGMLLFGEAAIMIAKPIMLRFLLMWLQGSVTFSSKQANLAYGYGLAVGLAALDFVQTFLHHKVFYITLREGWRLRTSVVGLMHKKILRLSSQVKKRHSKLPSCAKILPFLRLFLSILYPFPPLNNTVAIQCFYRCHRLHDQQRRPTLRRISHQLALHVDLSFTSHLWLCPAHSLCRVGGSVGWVLFHRGSDALAGLVWSSGGKSPAADGWVDRQARQVRWLYDRNVLFVCFFLPTFPFLSLDRHVDDRGDRTPSPLPLLFFQSSTINKVVTTTTSTIPSTSTKTKTKQAHERSPGRNPIRQSLHLGSPISTGHFPRP